MQQQDEIGRSGARDRQVKFRLSRDRKRRLEELAAAAGVSVQAFLEAKAFDEPFQELAPCLHRSQDERLFDVSA